MRYTGHVSPGGPAAHRRLERLDLTKVSVGPADNNAYLLRCRVTGEGLLVDAANDADRLVATLGGDGLAAVVTTHRHPDHWQALADVVAATGARSLAGALDAPELPVPTAGLADGETVRVGRAELRVIHLVGHTPGAIALLHTDPAGVPHLFSGDSLFPGGPGRTWSRPDFLSLMHDLESKVFDRLPDETWVYPGHGDDTTLGAERPHLRAWRERGW